ncbi:MAG: glycosyltransferase N-terminal domain-containing protein [Planctomycetales bacterium]
MKLLRNLIYAIVLLLFLIAGIVPRYRRLDVLKGFWERLTGAGPAIPQTARVAWFHAAGIGELMLCQLVIERLRMQHSDLVFAITVFDGEALQVAREKFPRDYVSLIPYDFTWAVRRARQRIHPSLFIIAENDIWPNLISVIGESGTPILIFNTRMTPREQTEHRWNGWLIRPALRHVSWWGVVQNEDAQWIETLFQLRHLQEIMGSLKIDGVSREKDSLNVQRLRQMWGFSDSETILVAGSTHAPEEEMMLTVYEQLQPLYPQLRA